MRHRTKLSPRLSRPPAVERHRRLSTFASRFQNGAKRRKALGSGLVTQATEDGEHCHHRIKWSEDKNLHPHPSLTEDGFWPYRVAKQGADRCAQRHPVSASTIWKTPLADTPVRCRGTSRMMCEAVDLRVEYLFTFHNRCKRIDKPSCDNMMEGCSSNDCHNCRWALHSNHPSLLLRHAPQSM